MPTTVREKIKVDKKTLERRAEKRLLKLFGKHRKKNNVSWFSDSTEFHIYNVI